MRILYVEDEKLLADAVVHLLSKSGISVDWVEDGEKGLELATKLNYDCIVLDIMLPKMSGVEILKTIRKNQVKTPVIMLSALSEVGDKVRGLEQGADDYLGKPFKAAELIARINALCRRPPLQTTKTYSFGDLTFDVNNRTLNDQTLTSKEADLMEILIKNPEQVHKKSALLAHIWGNEAIAEDNYVEVYISYLRKRLKELNSKVQIKSLRGLGYKLIFKENVQKSTK